MSNRSLTPDYKRRKRTGMNRIYAEKWLSDELCRRLEECFKHGGFSDSSQTWQDYHARKKRLRRPGVCDSLHFLWLLFNEPYKNEDLTDIATQINVSIACFKHYYPWFVQKHLMTMLYGQRDRNIPGESGEVSIKSTCEQQRRVLSDFADIGLLDRKEESDGGRRIILLKPNEYLNNVVNCYLDLCEGVLTLEDLEIREDIAEYGS